MQPRPPVAPRLPIAKRSGFTLLEVLIATVLSVLLMSAVYASINLYWKYSTSGRDEIERSQIARAVLRKIELDLRSIVFVKPPATDAVAATSTDTGSSTTSDTTVVLATPDEAATSSTSGLCGNQTTLMLYVNKPQRDIAFNPLADSQSAQTRSSDLRSVGYFISGSGGGALQGMLGVPGLARLEGDRLAMAEADQQANYSALAGQTQLLAPEVIAIQFHYFDGMTWRYNWDSTVFAGVPKAVEVVITMGPTVTLPSPQNYRLVVALPVGKPINTTMIQP